MGLTKKESDKIFSSPIFKGVDFLQAAAIFERGGCVAIDFEDGDCIDENGIEIPYNQLDVHVKQ